MQDKIRVLLADDHPLVRVGIRTTLEEANDIEVIGEAEHGAEILTLCVELVPDVLLLDLSMPDLDATAMVAVVQAELPQMKVIILSAQNTAAYVRNMSEANVDGYVLKDDAPEDVGQAIRTVMGGEVWYSQAVLQKMLAMRRGEFSQEYMSFKPRERQILALVAQGWSYAQVAAELDLAEQTIRNYLSNIYRVLKVNTRAEAMVWAINQWEKGF